MVDASNKAGGAGPTVALTVVVICAAIESGSWTVGTVLVLLLLALLGLVRWPFAEPPGPRSQLASFRRPPHRRANARPLARRRSRAAERCREAERRRRLEALKTEHLAQRFGLANPTWEKFEAEERCRLERIAAELRRQA
jgi:hypothetical protein